MARPAGMTRAIHRAMGETIRAIILARRYPPCLRVRHSPSRSTAGVDLTGTGTLTAMTGGGHAMAMTGSTSTNND
ncbi:hypothetical protein [Aminobacter sp. AP02]|uniref:hypothetical protein n=1 Tax=Aminobacter sp. AP02 TaxID=2135737 RepID=UPI000D7B723D|nr:hypothetical protein [Aminobacter sp. AP02]PWK71675.1 hypothetical protein C8K44_106187 [Aminobacter sp. AP02]